MLYHVNHSIRQNNTLISLFCDSGLNRQPAENQSKINAAPIIADVYKK